MSAELQEKSEPKYYLVKRHLLGLLRDNARTSVATLARKLRVARGTVQNRLARLESDGATVLCGHDAAQWDSVRKGEAFYA